MAGRFRSAGACLVGRYGIRLAAALIAHGWIHFTIRAKRAVTEDERRRGIRTCRITGTRRRLFFDCFMQRFPVHESMATDFQNGVEPRPCHEGDSVDQAEAG